MSMFGKPFRWVRIFVLSIVFLAPATFAVAQDEEHAVPTHEAPAAEGAHGGGAHHSMFATEAEPGQTSAMQKFAYSVINFGIMLGVLIFLLRKPLAEFLSTRRDDVRKSIDEAQAAKQKAEKSLAEHRQKMAAIEGELIALRSQILSTGERERDMIMTAANAQAAKIVDDARLIGEQEVRKAKAELREEMVKLAASLAEKALRSTVSPQEREKQMNEFVSKLEAL